MRPPAALVVVAVLAGACVEAPPAAPPVADGPVEALPQLPPHPAQAAAIADGDVTLEELRAALDAVIGCVRAAGFEAEVTEFDEDGGFGVSTSGDGPAGVAAADRMYTLCSSRHLDDVSLAYSEQHGPTPAELEAERRELEACLAARGGGEAPDAFDVLACDPDRGE